MGQTASAGSTAFPNVSARFEVENVDYFDKEALAVIRAHSTKTLDARNKYRFHDILHLWHMW